MPKPKQTAITHNINYAAGSSTVIYVLLGNYWQPTHSVVQVSRHLVQIHYTAAVCCFSLQPK